VFILIISQRRFFFEALTRGAGALALADAGERAEVRFFFSISAADRKISFGASLMKYAAGAFAADAGRNPNATRRIEPPGRVGCSVWGNQCGFVQVRRRRTWRLLIQRPIGFLLGFVSISIHLGTFGVCINRRDIRLIVC